MRIFMLCVATVMALCANLAHASDAAYFGCSLPKVCGPDVQGVSFTYLVIGKMTTLTTIVVTCYPKITGTNVHGGLTLTGILPTPRLQLPGALTFLPSNSTSMDVNCTRAEAGRPR